MISKERASKMNREELINKLKEMYDNNNLCKEALEEIVYRHELVEYFDRAKAQKTRITKLRKWVCNYCIYVPDPLGEF